MNIMSLQDNQGWEVVSSRKAKKDNVPKQSNTQKDPIIARGCY